MSSPSAESLEALISASPHAIFDLDVEGRVVNTWNTAAARMLGWTPEEVVGKVLPYVPEGSFPEFRQTLARVFAGETITGIETTRRRKDGTPIEVSIAAAPIRNGSPGIDRIMCIVEDITARKAQALQLARLGMAIEQSDVITIFTDARGIILYVNPAFVRATGYTEQEAVGKNPRFLKSGLQQRDFYEGLWDKLAQGQIWRGRIRNRRKDGTLYTAGASISPVRDGEGRLIGYIGLQRDITHQVEREDQLRQAQKMDALGQLTCGIAHDFNNLLTVMMANAELLGQDLPELSVESASGLRDIMDAARRGEAMVRRLLALSRQEGLQPAPLSLETYVDDFQRTLRRVLPSTIEIEMEVQRPLPWIWADRGAVEQMLLNLATNARDAMPHGGRLGIRVTQVDPVTVAVQIRDTGAGMDEETRRRAFEPFFTTKPPGKGTGLGLSMVYGLMHQHRGSVILESNPGQGTSVKLLFPVETASARPVESKETVQITGGKERILLVEDDESVRRIGSRMLRRLGYLVTEASDGLAALAVLEQEPGDFDLIVSDRTMPGMGGDELGLEVARRGIRIPFLLTTGYADQTALPVLRKPWNRETLSLAIRKTLEDFRESG